MKMKIEFVKETKLDGEVRYFTNIDGYYANGSLSFKEDEARKMYNVIVASKGQCHITEVLEKIEVEN